jgi:hypothetical protein
VLRTSFIHFSSCVVEMKVWAGRVTLSHSAC